MQKNEKNLKALCISASMAALYFGLDYIAISLSAPFGGTMKISVSGLPVIIVSILLGPIWGMATGFVGAFLGQLFSPYGLTATTLLWVLPAVVRGLSMGLLFKAFKQSLDPLTVGAEIVISGLLVTAFNTLAIYVDSKVFAYPAEIFGLVLVNRIIAAVLTSVVFAVIVPPIVRVMKKQIKL